MKRNLTSEKGGEFKSPAYQKAHEREFEKATSYMIELISTRFRNQVIRDLDKTTIDKFADAQAGNYSKVFLKLANQLRSKMVKQFDDKRIDHFVHELLQKTNKANRAGLYSMVEKRLGISSTELMATEGLSSTINALEAETAQWVKRLRDETLENYTASTLRVMATGGSLTDVLAQYDGMVEKRKNHAKFTARNQVATFNSLVTKARAQNLGFTQAKWVTAKDERVRPCHAVRNDKEFDLSKGLYSSCDGKTLLPGLDYQCRCNYAIIIPEED